ncbi:MAG: sulfotransferase [Pirellulaceae bacterium]|nr:sulfotransferase [Planctomycetales bacterium]
MSVRTYLRFLSENQGRIAPHRWVMAFLVLPIATFNSVMNRLQQLWFRRTLAETTVPYPPVFVLGHWRSGTTLLHELLTLDASVTYPTTYQCFAPKHFLLTQRWVTRLFWFILPERRPMDNVHVTWQAPQEDEFALLALGVASPYRRVGFPLSQDLHQDYLRYLDLTDVTPHELVQWKEALYEFVRDITALTPKPVVLKSPTHTARIARLLELFPDARFIHIARDPCLIIPSTIRLWTALNSAHSLQRVDESQLDDYVFACFQRMYRDYDRQKELIPSEHYAEIRYEDLVADPMGTMQTLYNDLQLGDFANVRERIETYCQKNREYRPNRHQPSGALTARIASECRPYMERFGYAE